MYHVLDIIYCICITTMKAYACLRPRARVKLAEMQKNLGTKVLMKAHIIFMTVNAYLRTVKLKTGIHAHI